MIDSFIIPKGITIVIFAENTYKKCTIWKF
jgi:hypothetical protein